ncbi:hypothetical protein D3C86_1797380 [compost metagenome]
MRLVVLGLLVAEGRGLAVEGDGHQVGLVLADHVQDGLGEAVDRPGGHALAGGEAHAHQGEVSPVRDGMAVDEHQAAGLALALGGGSDGERGCGHGSSDGWFADSERARW